MVRRRRHLMDRSPLKTESVEYSFVGVFWSNQWVQTGYPGDTLDRVPG